MADSISAREGIAGLKPASVVVGIDSRVHRSPKVGEAIDSRVRRSRREEVILGISRIRRITGRVVVVGERERLKRERNEYFQRSLIPI